MKKVYLKPAVQVVEVQQQNMLCGSGSAKLSAGYQVDGLGDGDADKLFDFEDDDFEDIDIDR